MKKINVILAAFLIAVTSVFTACGPSDEEQIAPTLSGLDVVTTPSAPTYKQGTTVTYTVQAGSSANELKTFTIGGLDLCTVSSVTTTPTGVLTGSGLSWSFSKNQTSVTINVTISIPASIAVNTNVTPSFTVTDDQDLTFTKQAATFAVKSSVDPIVYNILAAEWSAVTLGSQSNAADGCASSITGTKYSKTVSSSTDKQAIDIVYWYDGGARLVAPTNNTYNYAAIQGWATADRNATKFYKYTGTKTYAEITTEELLISSKASATSDNLVVATGDIIFVYTASGKAAVLKVGTITGTTDGTIVLTGKPTSAALTK